MVEDSPTPMTNSLDSAFRNVSHAGTAYGDASGTELSRARVDRVFTGALEGRSSAELLLCKTPNGVMSYAGTDCFEGQREGRPGTFVFQHAGIVENGAFTGFGYIVPGSATGAFVGWRGRAVVLVDATGAHSLRLELEPAS